MPFPGVPQLLVLAVAVLSVLILPLLGGYLYLSRSSRRYREAEESAKVLLRDLLSDREQQQLADSGYLTIPSPSVGSREYRIPARGGYVYGYESARVVMAICLQPAERLPLADVVLVHKLMIEGDELGYLRQANIQWLRASSAGNHNTGAVPLLPTPGRTEVLHL